MDGDQVTKFSLRKTETGQLKSWVTAEDLGALIIHIIYFQKRVDTWIPTVITATSRVTLYSNWKTCLSFSTPVLDKPRLCTLVPIHLVALKQVDHCLKHPQCRLWWNSCATLCASVGTITLHCALRGRFDSALSIHGKYYQTYGESICVPQLQSDVIALSVKRRHWYMVGEAAPSTQQGISGLTVPVPGNRDFSP